MVIQVKLFCNIGMESLERKINEWLSMNNSFVIRDIKFNMLLGNRGFYDAMIIYEKT